MKQDSKIHICGICAIIIAVVAGFWLFGLADQVFSFNSAVGENNDSVSDNYDKQNEEETLQPIQVKGEQIKMMEQGSDEESSQPKKELKNEPAISSSESSFMALYDEEPDVIEIETKLLQERVETLEESSFQLSGSGISWEGARHVSEYFEIKLELEPIAGTDLTEFKINSAKIKLGTLIVKLNQGTAKIQGNNFIIHTEQVQSMDLYLNMTGSFDGSIINDEKIQVHFKDQPLYLMTGDITPLYLDLETILSY